MKTRYVKLEGPNLEQKVDAALNQGIEQGWTVKTLARMRLSSSTFVYIVFERPWS